ncbi:nucleotidyltransferase domain-containing protein [Natroniella sp. ANB-PHB2]|uniref:nucleotidyltransferase domain-containing protein n=1 Tax=Natroniella sp. ANB-PHB2 TaxID=3384444 RepID=UPI0038D48013
MGLEDLELLGNQRKALSELKQNLYSSYPVIETIIFGSVARGEAEVGSDLDVLVLTKKRLSHRKKHEIYSIVTDINLQYDTNLSVLIIDKTGWESGRYSILPIKGEIADDGVEF